MKPIPRPLLTLCLGALTAALSLGQVEGGTSKREGARKQEASKRFVRFQVESLQWCDTKADEFRRRVTSAKVGKVHIYPYQLGQITAYWIDTDDGGSIALVCYDQTAMVFGQRNSRHLKGGSFMGDVYLDGPKCRYPEQREVFHQDGDLTVFWSNQDGEDNVLICRPGVTSITLSRVRA